MNELTDALREFISAPNLAVLATLRKDGSPHLSVVWYLYEGDEVKISLTDDKVKYRNVMRDPRVTLAIPGTVLPYKEVVFEGRAEVTPVGGPELIRQLSIHYYGEEEGNKYADYTLNVAKDNRLMLRFKPDRIIA